MHMHMCMCMHMSMSMYTCHMHMHMCMHMCMCAYVMHLHGQTFSLGYRSRSTYTAHVMYSNCGYRCVPYPKHASHGHVRCSAYSMTTLTRSPKNSVGKTSPFVTLTMS